MTNVDAGGRYWLVMGVCGVGKSSVAQALAGVTGGRFIDADDFHPRENVDKMSRGEPLTDDDRWPWLAAVAEAVKSEYDHTAAPVYFACSALKRRYRDLLRERLAQLNVLFLYGDEGVIRDRMTLRSAHYMSPNMLRSQLEALETPLDESRVWAIDVGAPPEVVLASCLCHVARVAP